MKIIQTAKTTKESYAQAMEQSSSCCGSDCSLKCKKCPPMTD